RSYCYGPGSLFRKSSGSRQTVDRSFCYIRGL
ncbi:tyrosine--tRNA ligase, partial [Chlamydia psittaci 08-2626_L3]